MASLEPPLTVSVTYIGDAYDVYTYAVESNRKHIYLCEISYEVNAIGSYDYRVICQTHNKDNLVASGTGASVKESVDLAIDMAKQLIERRR